MYCSKCGAVLKETAGFCSNCGTPVVSAPNMAPPEGFPTGLPGPSDAPRGTGTLVIYWRKRAMLIDFGTKIYINGQFIKEVYFTHDEVVTLPVWPGDHKLQACLSGFRNAEISVAIGAGETLSLDLEYSRAWGSIKFTKRKG